MQKNLRALTEGPIASRLLLFTLPILVGNILQSLNATVNSFWIGHYLGETALAASSNAAIVMFLVMGAMFGAFMAATILIGQYLGAGRLHDAKQVIGTATSFVTVLAVGLGVIGWVFCASLLHLMQTPEAAMPLAIAYMRVIFLSLPFMILYIFATSVLRGAGDARTPLYFLCLSVGLDIGLNPVFIFGLGPAPRLGIAGSALATLLAQAISLFVLIVFLYRRKNPLMLHKGEFGLLRMDWSIVRTLVVKGIPMAMQMMVMSLSMVLMISLVNGFGIDTTAAFGAATQVWNYIQMPAFAISMAVSSMAAQNIGARLWDRVAAITRLGVVYQLLLTGALVCLIEVIGPSFLGLFLPDRSPSLAIALHMNTIVAWSFIFFGISLVLFGVVRANGAVIAPLLILVLSLLGLRFPMAWLLMDSWHADAIWWSFPASSALSVILAFIYYNFGRWREARMMTPQAAAAAVAASTELG